MRKGVLFGIEILDKGLVIHRVIAMMFMIFGFSGFS